MSTFGLNCFVCGLSLGVGMMALITEPPASAVPLLIGAALNGFAAWGWLRRRS